MKQGINIHMPVKFSGIDFCKITEIKFLFKQRNSISATELKKSIYKADGTGDAQLLEGSTNVVLVPWNSDETYRFAKGTEFFMDTKIKVENTVDNPITPIVRLVMNDTLFEEGDD